VGPEEVLGVSVEVVGKPPTKPVPEKVREGSQGVGARVGQGGQGGGLAEVDAAEGFSGLAT
jgi:hypothetical protein